MSGVIRELDIDNCCSPKASSYDRFSAGLVASILICGFLVLGLLAVWMFGDQSQAYGIPPTLDPHPDVVIGDDGGSEEDLDEIVEGSGSTELVSFLKAVENSVSQQSAEHAGLGRGEGPFGTLGIPDIRKPGPDEPKSPWARWKVSFEVENIQKYKQQLDFLGVEIGVVARAEDDVWRIGSLSADASVALSSREKEKHSFYFAHSKPILKRWDRQIAAEAGIESKDRLFVQFYPPRLVAKITMLEAEKLQELGRELDEVVRTRIRISESGEHFSVSITDIEFR